MKPVTIICLIMLAINAHAQIGKGKNVLSGDISFLTSNTSGSTSMKTDYSNFDIIPRYGYFFGEKTEAGISTGYRWMKEHGTSTDPLNSYSVEGTSGLFLAGPYVRFYQNLAERFYFNFSASATFFTGNSKTSNDYSLSTNKTEYSIFEFQIGIAPGLVYFYNNHWASNISLGLLQYDSKKMTDKETDNNTTTNVFNGGINSGGLIFGIGFYF